MTMEPRTSGRPFEQSRPAPPASGSSSCHQEPLLLVLVRQFLRPLKPDPTPRLLPLVKCDSQLRAFEGARELAHGGEARDARRVAGVHAHAALDLGLDALILANGDVLQQEEQGLPLGVGRAVVVHEDRQDPDARRGVPVAHGSAGHSPLLTTAEDHAALRKGDQILRRWILASRRPREEQLRSRLVLSQREPFTLVKPTQSLQGHLGEDVAQSELLLQGRVVDTARPRQLPAALVYLEVIRALFPVGQPLQPGKHWHINALPECVLQRAGQLPVPVQQFHRHDRVDDGISLLLHVRHLLFPRHSRRRRRWVVHHLYVPEADNHGGIHPPPLRSQGLWAPAAQCAAAADVQAAVRGLRCRARPAGCQR
mmetsp:Transcript_76436/g.202982  ORF Transcript_76436/g.202982 Transcript_76436/m.202982 type:complete len:368 (-) Transcript_76436:357-1460(-)